MSSSPLSPYIVFLNHASVKINLMVDIICLLKFYIFLQIKRNQKSVEIETTAWLVIYIFYTVLTMNYDTHDRKT